MKATGPEKVPLVGPKGPGAKGTPSEALPGTLGVAPKGGRDVTAGEEREQG